MVAVPRVCCAGVLWRGRGATWTDSGVKSLHWVCCQCVRDCNGMSCGTHVVGRMEI